MRAVVVVLALIANSCAYEYGSRATGPTFTGVGWDSGIAYGSARESAERQGHKGLPTRVAAHCMGTAGKAVGLAAVGSLMAAGAKDMKSEAIVGLSVLALVAAVLAPNCAAELTYAPAATATPTAAPGAPATPAAPAPPPEPAPVQLPPPPTWSDPFR